MTFNIGDRVRYFGPYAKGGKADFGTISSRNIERAGSWWVDWDSGEHVYVQEQHIELIAIMNRVKSSLASRGKNFLSNSWRIFLTRWMILLSFLLLILKFILED